MPRNASGNYGGSAKPTIKSQPGSKGPQASMIQKAKISDLGMGAGFRESGGPAMSNSGGAGPSGKG